MNKIPLSKTKIESKVATIRDSLEELNKISRLSKKEFEANKDNFAITEHYLRRALEALFDIANHIVSRFPYSAGKRPYSYKGLALALADRGIVNKNFGNKALVNMAGYRNRLVHFYDEITPKELYEIITTKLGDFETFVKAVLRLVKNPEKFGLTIEE
ncbi:MAG: hypothetical protein UY09_C0044G0003 [Parcubacteria group bacterium GW2011_GWA2_47_8]|nr:MAG: hypothetical protein UY09_C0044G0003 [Parcubacteria group bacterium GW2011_GWA2_47_8]